MTAGRTVVQASSCGVVLNPGLREGVGYRGSGGVHLIGRERRRLTVVSLPTAPLTL
jgi:hypothetical protein